MNHTISTTMINSFLQEKGELDRVMGELDHFRQQVQRLDIMNQLHRRMAEVLDLAGMIETYSIWLMPLVEHELIGYANSKRSKHHLFCSGHGPERRMAIAFAEKLLKDTRSKAGVHSDENGQYAHKWIFETVDNAGILLILREGRELDSEDLSIVNESLVVLSYSLQRALEYEEIFELARRDALTGLANRRVFDERIDGIVESARRHYRPLCMASLDLDHFKQVNDNLGHKKGDQVLQQVADLFSSLIRTTDLLVRFGGDEFMLILPDTTKESARILAERICAAVSRLGVWVDDETKMGVSIGVAEWVPDETLDEWMERADDILYHAKAAGRSRVSLD